MLPQAFARGGPEHGLPRQQRQCLTGAGRASGWANGARWSSLPAGRDPKPVGRLFKRAAPCAAEGGAGAAFPLPGDDLLALSRPCGLPIGNLTSQFWSNCYLDPLDQFVRRTLRQSAYLRYVDDFALFDTDRARLEDANHAIRQFLQERLRLQVHEGSAQVQPCAAGVPWLGFVVYPQHIRVKGRKVVEATRRLRHWHAQWQDGHIPFAELDARVQGWIAHVAQADSWGLRAHVLGQLPLQARFAAGFGRPDE